jgi:hypothetical protein
MLSDPLIADRTEVGEPLSARPPNRRDDDAEDRETQSNPHDAHRALPPRGSGARFTRDGTLSQSALVDVCEIEQSGWSRPDEPSMNQLSVRRLVRIFEMRNFQLAHSLDDRAQRFVRGGPTPDVLSRGPKGAQHLRPIESLPVAMFAEAHALVSVKVAHQV